MSQENVELVRKLHAAFSRGDLDAFLSGWHPDAEYRAAIQQAVEGESGTFRGHDGLRRWFRELHDLYDDLHTTVLEIRDLGDDLVVVFAIRGRGSSSGVVDEFELAQVVRFREGKVFRVRDYRSRAEALDASGLSE